MIAGSLGNYYGSGSTFVGAGGYLVTFTLEESLIGIEGNFAGVTGGTLSFASIDCIYDTASSTSTFWVCLTPQVNKVNPPNLLANYSVTVSFEMSGGATIDISLTDIITFVRPSINNGSLIINNGTASSMTSLASFGAVNVQFGANEWKLERAFITAGLAAAGISYASYIFTHIIPNHNQIKSYD